MKQKMFMITINLLVIFWYSFFYLRNNDFSNKIVITNYCCFTLTLLLPTILLIVFTVKRYPKHLNEIYIAPIIVTIAFMMVNLFVMIFISIFNKNSMYLTLIVEGIMFTIYFILILIISIGNNHIIKINKKGE